MNRFFQKLKDFFSAGADTWQQPNPNPPVMAQPPPTAQAQNARPASPQVSTYDFREQMIQNEFMAENCTQEQHSVHVFGPTAGGSIPGTFKHESFTPNGLLTSHADGLITSAEGRLIKPPELHGGGLCHSCGHLTDKLNFCAVCKMPLCFRCFHTFESLIVCNLHYQVLYFNKDTWSKQP